jgi:hypothetical protein
MDSSLALRIWSISSMAEAVSTLSFWTCGGGKEGKEKVQHGLSTAGLAAPVDC